METDICEPFQRAEEIARKWNKFSLDCFGWETREYNLKDMVIWCYFAENSDHSAIQFRHKDYGKIEIAFHSPVQFGHFELSGLRHLREIIETATAYLDVSAATHKAISAEERARSIKVKIESLERQLAEAKKEAA